MTRGTSIQVSDADEHGAGGEEERAADVGRERGGSPAHGRAPAALGRPRAGRGEQRDSDDDEADPADDRDHGAAGEGPGVREVDVEDQEQPSTSVTTPTTSPPGRALR